MTEVSGTAESAVAAESTALLTFLLADLRGYTAYSHDRGDESAGFLSELFLALCREVVATHGGQVFGSAGDQALAAFSSARQALRAAVALQERLAQEQDARPELPLRPGIGLDMGEAVRVGSDFRGGAINLAARLCSIAGPGEIFSSEAVTHAARKTNGLVYLDRGEVMLKGLPTPVRVIQIAPEGTAPAELPPLQPLLGAHPTNLPDEPTPFIGRERELREVGDLLQQPGVRLVTLTGPGGTGKTRLALQVGNTLLHDFRDGVFLVSLASLTDPALAAPAIAETLGVKEEGGRELLNTLMAALQKKHLLLILDNFEHLPDASAAVSSLLDACRFLHVLITSRMPLHLSREREYPVMPLSVPDPEQLSSLEELKRYEAVALFVERAGAVKPSFALTNENAPAVAEICRRLDGLPLAIELAAARVKLFPPQALLSRLSSRLQLLTGGARDRPTRQQTLRRAIDWSYSLLTPDEQTLFARLSVFAGGCTFEAAEAVCNSDGSLDLLDGLASLVDKSLLRQVGEEEPRFVMLETIREYAQHALQDTEGWTQVADRHAAYFAALVDEAEQVLEAGRGIDPWLHRLELEHTNIRSALDWFEAQHNVSMGLRMASGLWRFWTIRGHLAEGRERLERLLETAGTVQVGRYLEARAQFAAGALAHGQVQVPTAIRHWERAESLYRHVGDTAGMAMVLNALGVGATELGEYVRARRLLERSIATYRETGQTVRLGHSLNNLANVVRYTGDNRGAMALYEESLGAYRTAGAQAAAAQTLNNLGQLVGEMGDYDRAIALAQESLALMRQLEDRSGIASALINLGGTELDLGNLDRARALLEDGLELQRTLGAEGNEIFPLQTLGQIALRQGDHSRARELSERALLLSRSHDSKRGESYVLHSLGDLALEVRDLEQANRLYEEAFRLSLEIGFPLGIAESLERLARLAIVRGAAREAVALYAQAAAIRDRVGAPMVPIDRGAYERNLEALRTALGEEVFSSLWNEGWGRGRQ